MNKKLKLILLGGAILATALVGINASVDKSANWNLIMKNAEALANEEWDGTLWDRDDEDCVYTFTGVANRGITITVGGQTISGRYDQDGEFEYRVCGGKTRCTAGGYEQCTARYCPVVIVVN